MISWTDIEVKQMEHAQRVQRSDQVYWMQLETVEIGGDRWQWRVMNKLGGWLIESGNRLQRHAAQARQVVRTSSLALDTNSNSSQPCP